MLARTGPLGKALPLHKVLGAAASLPTVHRYVTLLAIAGLVAVGLAVARPSPATAYVDAAQAVRDADAYQASHGGSLAGFDPDELVEARTFEDLTAQLRGDATNGYGGYTDTGTYDPSYTPPAPEQSSIDALKSVEDSDTSAGQALVGEAEDAAEVARFLPTGAEVVPALFIGTLAAITWIHVGSEVIGAIFGGSGYQAPAPGTTFRLDGTIATKLAYWAPTAANGGYDCSEHDWSWWNWPGFGAAHQVGCARHDGNFRAGTYEYGAGFTLPASLRTTQPFLITEVGYQDYGGTLCDSYLARNPPTYNYCGPGPQHYITPGCDDNTPWWPPPGWIGLVEDASSGAIPDGSYNSNGQQCMIVSRTAVRSWASLPKRIHPYHDGDPVDGSAPLPAAPSLAAAVHNSASVLTDGNHDTFLKWVNHRLDPRCHPDPLSSTVTVPEVLANESVDDYQACLQTLGLQSTVVTLPETDLDTGDGDVVFADPESGEKVDPDEGLKVIKNPNAPTTRPEPKCELADGEGPQPDPGNPPPDGTGFPQYQQQFSYPSTDPTSTPPGQPRDLPLKWGTTDWGWRHIMIRHGYGADDAADTAEALATDVAPTLRYAGRQQYLYRKYYPMPDGEGGTLNCARTVVVEYAPDRLGYFRGVTNSFAGEVVAP
jgi:PASTA domain